MYFKKNFFYFYANKEILKSIFCNHRYVQFSSLNKPTTPLNFHQLINNSLSDLENQFHQTFRYFESENRAPYRKLQVKAGLDFDKHRNFPSILLQTRNFLPSHDIARAFTLEVAPKICSEVNRINSRYRRTISTDYRHFTSTLYNSFT